MNVFVLLWQLRALVVGMKFGEKHKNVLHSILNYTFITHVPYVKFYLKHRTGYILYKNIRTPADTPGVVLTL
jgi:putative heme iron utilization protein